jgi:hypothetical protein
VGLLGSIEGAPCELWFFFFLGAFRRTLLYLRCNWVALNLRLFDIYNTTYKKKVDNLNATPWKYLIFYL